MIKLSAIALTLFLFCTPQSYAALDPGTDSTLYVGYFFWTGNGWTKVSL